MMHIGKLGSYFQEDSMPPKASKTPLPLPDTDAQKLLGQYPTPVWVADALIERHFAGLDSGDLVIEPSCGPGSFLAALPKHVPAIGIDVDARMVESARRQTGRKVLHGDFRTLHLDFTPTAILGNPPFNLLSEIRNFTC
jgi:site-specific DNA-methyltransferase (adenine-specific)